MRWRKSSFFSNLLRDIAWSVPAVTVRSRWGKGMATRQRCAHACRRRTHAEDILDAQGDRVDEITHQLVRLGKATAGHGCADDNVGLRRVAEEERVKGCRTGVEKRTYRQHYETSEMRTPAQQGESKQPREMRTCEHDGEVRRLLLPCCSLDAFNGLQRIGEPIRTSDAYPAPFLPSCLNFIPMASARLG